LSKTPTNMAIIAYLGRTVKEYQEKSYELLQEMEIYCPQHPEKRAAYHCSYVRGIKETGEKIDINRLICYECRKTMAVLPDFLLPYKQFSANEIEAVIIDSETTEIYDIDSNASVYTVRRWLKEMSGRMTGWVSRLKALLTQRQELVPSEISLADLPLIEQIKSLLVRLPKIRTCGNVLGHANIWLQTLGLPNST